MRGLYIVVEGSDGTGKTTIVSSIAKQLNDKFPQREIVQVQQPGGTHLGKHLRKLVKTPSLIDPNIIIDDLSRQLLYMVDSVATSRQIIQPAIDRGAIVISDRSAFVSSIVYGLCDNLNIADIERLNNVMAKPPYIDRMFILTCPPEIAKTRVYENRKEMDHYDFKSLEFNKRINDAYLHLLDKGDLAKTLLLTRFVNFGNIQYIDTSRPPNDVINTIFNHIIKTIDQYS